MGASSSLRANIRETQVVPLINEQGEKEKGRDEWQFSWCSFLGGLWLARNGAKASEASRSVVERQSKRAAAPGPACLPTPKWLPKPIRAPIPRSTNIASWSRRRLLLPSLVASALCFAAKVCTRRC